MCLLKCCRPFKIKSAFVIVAARCHILYAADRKSGSCEREGGGEGGVTEKTPHVNHDIGVKGTFSQEKKDC